MWKFSRLLCALVFVCSGFVPQNWKEVIGTVFYSTLSYFDFAAVSMHFYGHTPEELLWKSRCYLHVHSFTVYLFEGVMLPSIKAFN